jgi:hypothetical protein
MRRARTFYSLLGIGLSVLSLALYASSASQQDADLTRTLGKWSSVEQFEGEPRISVSFRSTGPSIEGWAVLLGQHRKNDDRATLALSFTNATWDGQSIRFSTILPEDEGTLGWELHATTPAAAVLSALTENGQPLPEPLNWVMTK